MKAAFHILIILAIPFLPACGGNETQDTESAESVSEPHAEETVSPFLDAVRARDLEKVKKLITTGARVDVRDKEGYTALHKAAALGNADLADILLANGADPGAKGENDLTPLHIVAGSYMCHEGQRRIAQFLVERGVDPDTRDADGWTPLHHAARNGYEEMAEFLIAKGADVNATDNERRTPLDVAQNYMVTPLLKHGARIQTFTGEIREKQVRGDLHRIREALGEYYIRYNYFPPDDASWPDKLLALKPQIIKSRPVDLFDPDGGLYGYDCRAPGGGNEIPTYVVWSRGVSGSEYAKVVDSDSIWHTADCIYVTNASNTDTGR